jgi:hypothetical protein
MQELMFVVMIVQRKKELIGMRKKKCTMSIPAIIEMYLSARSLTETFACYAISCTVKKNHRHM